MDESNLFIGLFRSLALSALIILAFSKVIRLTPGGKITDISVGILFAAAGFVSMSDPVTFAPGIFYDGRIPILALAYSFSGISGTIISTLVIGGYRMWLGGAGAIPGLIGILIAAASGVAVGRLPNRLFKRRLSKPLVLGLASSSLSMLSILVLPQAALAAVSIHVLAPVVVVNIIGVIILHDFLANETKSLRLFRTLEHDAAIDPLTRLSNRRAFDARAAGALHPQQNPSGSYSVIMIDIDHFKSVNDTYGHDAGDSVLATVATIIKSCVRKTDIVARFGGEEIAVLMPGLDTTKATAVAEKIRDRIEAKQFVAANTNMRITVSLGAAGANTKTASVASALKAADVALYSAKRAGRNRVETALVA
jgi:diguanylate cyclase